MVYLFHFMMALGFSTLMTASPLPQTGSETATSTQNPAPQSIQLPQEVLDEYVGAYQLLPQVTMTISREGDKLFATPTGQPKAEIFATEMDEFFLTFVKATISFKRDESDQVVAIIVTQNGEPVEGKRINPE